MTDETRCVWLYGVTADGAASAAYDATGVGGGPLRTVRAAGLAAVVEDVAEREFGAAALRRNLEDLDWLDRVARAHHAVIEAMTGRGPVVPMRLATVYSGDDPVAETLQQRAGDLREALSRLRARSEWGVKAYTAEPSLASADPGGDGAPAAGPGAAYLQRRRAQLTARKAARQQATASAQAVHAELGRLSVSARLYPPQSPDLAGQATPMVLNAAYLVADDRAGEFADAVAELAGWHRSVRLALTGPWPPYSFAGEHGAASEDDAGEHGAASQEDAGEHGAASEDVAGERR